MPASVEVAGPQSIDIMMPKKRQQGFDPGAIGGVSAPGVGPTATAPSGAAFGGNTFFGPFGSNGLPSSFIDTDILLNDDLWNQFSPATTNNSSTGTDTAGQQQTSGLNINVKTDSPNDQAFGESYLNIPHSGSFDMFGLQSRTFASVRPAHDALSRLSKDASSMDDADSPDGSNGETTSTIATSVISPSSIGTTVGSLPKGTGAGRHHRSTSNASSTNRSKTARSLSRSRTRVAASASERRTADRSPSLERGGVGKAPSSRARASRRATVGPAALAGGLQSHANPPAPTRSSSSTAASQASMGLSSSFQAQNHRWSLFGTPDASNSSNLQLNFNRPSASAQGQPGTTSASSSLPTPLNFHTSMAHLNLQTPPVHHLPHRLHEDANSSQSFNPFLFPPYTQASSHSASAAMDSLTQQPSDLQAPAGLHASERSSETPEFREVRPTTATKARRPSKTASQASRDNLAKEIKQEAVKLDLKKVSSEEPQQGDDDEDDEGGDDDDEHPSGATGGKSEAEAKRLAEKRRKRRESHNAVERRRRDNINEKITELATLLPEAMLLDAIATSTQGGNSGTFAPALAAKAALAAAAAAAAKGDTVPDSSEAQPNLPKSSTEAYAAALAPVHANSAALAAAQAKPNKGIILRKSVEYIRHLQQFLDMQMGRIGFLEAELARSHQALAASGMQAPPTTDPQQGLGMMHAFFSQSDAGSGAGAAMFGEQQQQQQQQQQTQQQPQHNQHGQQFHQQPLQDFSAMNLLSLGMPMDQPSQAQSMHQSNLGTPHSGSGAHDAINSAPALAAWLEGFDQRTGLPRRSSVDPIEEEEHESGQEDKELSRRGHSQSSRHTHDAHDEHWRGRPRHKISRGRAQVQEGSWPELQPSEAQSPMQLVSAEEGAPAASFAELGEMKLDL
ncbi:uncharacterized protein SRS1_14007 [Sporisorium reilianum f. sp. reilianum]|uniref:BHLH domain-containing protein n=1 Tax=Sporisorium reilianum f. sp. reilianum TaxID=72559 RepID=A0A2N8UFL3_9BASI|nr:uncharacterized protein SRS1_14007 [Sporisorium reilianum f. sp. reilianum]